MPPSEEIWFLDIASKMGVAEGVPGERPRLYTVELSRPDDTVEDRFGRAARWAADRLRESVPRALYVEAPIQPGAMKWGTNAKTVVLLNGYWAVIVGIFRLRGIRVETVAVSTVRAYVLGNGRMAGHLAKAEVMRLAREEGYRPANDNEGDAWAGWKWASSLSGSQTTTGMYRSS